MKKSQPLYCMMHKLHMHELNKNPHSTDNEAHSNGFKEWRPIIRLWEKVRGAEKHCPSGICTQAVLCIRSTSCLTSFRKAACEKGERSVPPPDSWASASWAPPGAGGAQQLQHRQSWARAQPRNREGHAEAQRCARKLPAVGLRLRQLPPSPQSWALVVFLKFFSTIKMIFFVKLIWLRVGFLYRIGTEIGYRE